MTNNQLLMPLWINKSVASYVLIKLVDTACRLRGCHLPLSNVSPTPAAPKQTAAAGVEPWNMNRGQLSVGSSQLEQSFKRRLAPQIADARRVGGTVQLQRPGPGNTIALDFWNSTADS